MSCVKSLPSGDSLVEPLDDLSALAPFETVKAKGITEVFYEHPFYYNFQVIA